DARLFAGAVHRMPEERYRRVPRGLYRDCRDLSDGRLSDVTLSASGSGPCGINGKRKVTLNAFVNYLPASTVFHWEFGDASWGHPKNATATGTWPSPAAPQVNEHEYDPGIWQAT